MFFIRSANKSDSQNYSSKQVRAYDDYPFIFGQLDTNTWVLIDEDANVIPGAEITNSQKYIRFQVSKLKDYMFMGIEQNHIYTEEGELLFSFDKDKELAQIIRDGNEIENAYFVIKPFDYKASKEKGFDVYNCLFKSYKYVRINSFGQMEFEQDERKYFLGLPR